MTEPRLVDAVREAIKAEFSEATVGGQDGGTWPILSWDEVFQSVAEAAVAAMTSVLGPPF